MEIPSPITSWLATLIYALMMYILFEGVRRYVLIHKQKEKKLFSSLIYLGAIATILGIIGYIGAMAEAFDAIEAAGDISPSIIAGSFKYALGYPVIGLLCLCFSYLFQYFTHLPD